METKAGGALFLERDDREPLSLDVDFGRVVVFSACSPHHEKNEDGAAALPYPGGGVIAVADGMGGLNAGEAASRTTLETLRSGMNRAAKGSESLRNVLLDGIESANRAVIDLGVGAGATLAAFSLRDGRARAVHVGDCMALHVGQRGSVKALTVSHSPTGYAVEAGWLDENDAMHHEDRHLVSNYVGFEDMRIEIGPAMPIARRDTLLVASDGLADNLTLDEIVGIVRKGKLVTAAARLAELAIARMSQTSEVESGVPSKPDDLTFVLYRRKE